SGAALQHLRQVFPGTPFVGLVPPVKPAAEQTKSGKIAVLATSVTLQGKLYLNVKNKFAGQVVIYQDTCSGLVSQIEKGEIEHPATRHILQEALKLPLQQGIDKVVLGCTHYPFAASVIQDIVGESIELIDAAPAIARHAACLLETHQILPDDIKVERFVSTDNSDKLQSAIKNLLHEGHHTIESIYWMEKLTLN
ncbi:MAG: aspartate/glutamate racemase family protein, partial [Anaerolineaceae bacterium]|nr:aspartate/glutamate racemase family protein [Anaerolineaceae bacterium]